MIIRSKAPLRLGLAGGGTDVSPYSDLYGGAILNATISLFAYATLKTEEKETVNDSSSSIDFNIHFEAADRNEHFRKKMEDLSPIEIDDNLALVKGIYNRIIKDFPEVVTPALKSISSLTITTYVDAPAGSGLGTSSTLVVAILGAFVEWLKLPLGEYDIAHLAYEIERCDLSMSGGKQDQYAATFGGFNFMEFYEDDRVIVNPLRIKRDHVRELEFNLLLYNTGTSRVSAEIIEHQKNNVNSKNTRSIESTHELKKQAILLKEYLLKGHIDEIGHLLNRGWEAKKKVASQISNGFIDDIYRDAMKAGAIGGKISGAGGGGFMLLYCPEVCRYAVKEVLESFGGEVKQYQFVDYGLRTWEAK